MVAVLWVKRDALASLLLEDINSAYFKLLTETIVLLKISYFVFNSDFGKSSEIYTSSRFDLIFNLLTSYYRFWSNSVFLSYPFSKFYTFSNSFWS